ncbi:uncharacterized protein A4U43_C09F16800 [Asparagus officinalis]|uniref:RIN4 pathogenic type III effector avirulence factor Avr cleavage site domain-containing protein n=1 Tax=Asparagus officinalis TaxID=4686 RepID=A0A5P1EA16_ASPOF|nr:uncharacterized protein LOC109824754 [Asparagus officinalis]ONK58803.1 uncharacterized protein A4U43_C09F16800 [Asparagus officinalis]
MEGYSNGYSDNTVTRRVQIPAFGDWDYCDEMPITQYFESAMQAGLIRGHFFADEDAGLFKAHPPPAPAPPPRSKPAPRSKKVKGGGGGGGEKRQQQAKEQLRKQGRVYDLTPQSPRKPARAPKAVDEDLYKIPPELLRQKPKRKRMLRKLLSGCLGLNCVA